MTSAPPASGAASSRATKIRKGLANPGTALAYVVALARGRQAIFWNRLLGRHVTAGRNFRIGGRLVIRGPGRVIFGDNVNIERVVTPWTYAPDAVIEIGSNSFLNGTKFGCRRSIIIGPRAILSDASISDTDFHSTHVDRHSPDAPVRVRPVVIEENVWLGGSVGILAGTHIGRNSVVGFGAVCSGTYPANSVIAGNPARVVKHVPGAVEPDAAEA